jgi:tRNA(fMet)-specific endonuclease VapC
MKYVLDTDILSLWEANDPLVTQRVRDHKGEGVGTTIVTIEEQYDGWKKRLKKARKRELVRVYTEMLKAVRFLANLPILTYSNAAYDKYEELLADFHATNDLRIAAIAMSKGAILVTNNTAHFEPISRMGLLIENWVAT